MENSMKPNVSRVTLLRYISFFDTRVKVLFCMNLQQCWGRMPIWNGWQPSARAVTRGATL